MERPIDLDALCAVFSDHPWLAEAVSNGAWWARLDGTVRVVAPLEDPLAVQAGIDALADAIGCRVETASLPVQDSVDVGQRGTVTP